MIHTSFKLALILVGAMVCMTVSAAVTSSAKEQPAKYVKRPDWSGIWMLKGNVDIFDKPDATDTDYERGAHDDVPYNAEWQAKYTDNRRRSRLQGVENEPDQLVDTDTLYCRMGMPRIMSNPFEFQFIHLPNMSLIIVRGEVRRIYVDGRTRPDEDIIWSRVDGWSLGQWHGEVLEVETTHIYPGLWGDSTAIQFSDQLKINERIYSVDANTIQDDVVITDPVALTRPWKVSRRYLRRDVDHPVDGKVDIDAWPSDGELCHAREDRHPIENGQVTTKLKSN